MAHISNPSGSKLTNPTDSSSYELKIVQQPANCKAVTGSLKARGVKWPIDPPPVLHLIPPTGPDASKTLHVHNPNFFCYAALVSISKQKSRKERDGDVENCKDNLFGLMSSSLHRVKGIVTQDEKDNGVFVFADLNVRETGRYKIVFTLFEMRKHSNELYAATVASADSQEFNVVPNKTAIPNVSSTVMSKALSEAGIKIKLRKESSKRKTTQYDWSSGLRNNYPHNKAQVIAPNQPTSMGPPSQNMSGNALRYARANGEDVSHRMSMSETSMPFYSQRGVQQPSSSPHGHMSTRSPVQQYNPGPMGMFMGGAQPPQTWLPPREPQYQHPMNSYHNAQMAVFSAAPDQHYPPATSSQWTTGYMPTMDPNANQYMANPQFFDSDAYPGNNLGP